MQNFKCKSAVAEACYIVSAFAKQSFKVTFAFEISSSDFHINPKSKIRIPKSKSIIFGHQ
jgi:hypothetical protein